MNEPVHSRGTGRSGPKRKTGCLTCRRRKVRCDEDRPVCQNCIRLRLDCEYAPPRARSFRTTSSVSPPKTSIQRTLSVASQGSAIDVQQTSTMMSTAQPIVPISTTVFEGGSHQWNTPDDPTASFSAQFSEHFMPSLESFDIDVGLTDSSEAFLGLGGFPGAHNAVTTASDSNATVTSAASTSFKEENRTHELLEHFVQSVNPMSLIQPTNTEWPSACRYLVSMANDCVSLLSAICSFSALQLYCTMGDDCFDEAFQHYKLASREANKVLSYSSVDDRQLKRAFATIFLLVNLEMLAQTTAKGRRHSWPLQHLHSFHHRVRQHHEHIRVWRGGNRRLLTWTTILQTKAEWNSGHQALQHSSTALAQFTGDSYARTPSTISNESFRRTHNYDSHIYGDESILPEDTEQDLRNPAEIAYDTFHQPTYDFYLKSQALTSRISSLGYHNQEKDEVEMDFENLKEGQRINADLHTLWSCRPGTMQLLHNSNGLSDVLQPQAAQRLLLQLRVYAANFFAQFIHLHRAAFAGLPISGDVQNAVTRILGLTKDILGSAAERRRSATQPPPTSSIHGTTTGAPEAVQDTQLVDLHVALPLLMLWPLFLAATESGAADRLWILETLKEVDKRTCPSMARTRFLLEELLRRQDQEGRRIDHLIVRKEIFEGNLSVIF